VSEVLKNEGMLAITFWTSALASVTNDYRMHPTLRAFLATVMNG
jgi:hypothetical protein